MKTDVVVIGGGASGLIVGENSKRIMMMVWNTLSIISSRHI